MTFNEAVVRHSYEQAASRLARLALFAETGESRGHSYAITYRQGQLAIDDVINLAIAGRRLIDSLDLRHLSLQRHVRSIAAGMTWPHGNQVAPDNLLHDLLNKIIHSSYIEIFNFLFQQEQQDDVIDHYNFMIDKEKYRIPPLLAVRSDRGPVVFCDLRQFCLACDEIVQAGAEAALTAGINFEDI